jgi:hypothetical protein
MAKRTKKTEEIDLTSKENQSDQTLPASGLGDVISKVTSVLGIPECPGCEKRKQSLNSAFHWLRTARDYTEEEIVFIRKVESKSSMTNDEANFLFSLYNEIFPSPRRLERCNCPGLILKIIQRLSDFIPENNK